MDRPDPTGEPAVSSTIFDRGGLNVASIARPGGPRLSIVLEGSDAVLDVDQVRELVDAIREWLEARRKERRG